MNRRNFLSLFSAGVAGFALDQAIPLGRVWSFPKEIVVPAHALTIDDISRITVDKICFSQAFHVEDLVSIRAPGLIDPQRKFVITQVHLSDCNVMPNIPIGSGLELGAVPKPMLRHEQLDPRLSKALFG